MVKVKICGITNLEDALAAFFYGADALGFVFYKKSSRYIDPRRVKNISAILPKKIRRVGVFVDEKPSVVKRIAKSCRLDMLQFHGQESNAYCRKFKGYKVIKAFRIASPQDLDKISGYKTYAYLFDSFSPVQPGGTGKKFNWKILAPAVKIKPVVFISGGLTNTNVGRAIKLFRPGWVDASSGLEDAAQGKKDHYKLKRFIRAAKPEAKI